jgi:hypothetical protein
MSSEWDSNEPEPGATIVGFTPVSKAPAPPAAPDDSGQTVIGLRRLAIPPAGAAAKPTSNPPVGLGSRLSPNFGSMAMPAPAPAAAEAGTVVGLGRIALPTAPPAAPDPGGTMVGIGRVALPTSPPAYEVPDAGGTMVGVARISAPGLGSGFGAPLHVQADVPEAGGTMVGVARISAPGVGSGFGAPLHVQADVPEAGGTMVGVARINAPGVGSGFGAPLPVHEDVPDAGGTMVGGARVNAPASASFGAPPVTRLSGPPPAYEIIKHLGGGDLGQVFHARHRENGAEVALRIIRPDLAAVPGAVDAARDVVALAQGAQHTHLGIQFQLDETASPTYVVEYVPGRLLSSIMQERGLAPTGAVIDLGVRLCSALAAAHGVGLAHGRVHAGNVILEAKTGRWVLVDLGHGYVMQALEPAHDLYALAALLYEMATAHAPFEQGDVAPDPRSYVPTIPPTLAALLMRALAADPSLWFPSALEFAQALSRARAQIPPAHG